MSFFDTLVSENYIYIRSEFHNLNILLYLPNLSYLNYFTIPICMDSKIVGRYFGHRSIFRPYIRFSHYHCRVLFFSRFWYGVRIFVRPFSCT